MDEERVTYFAATDSKGKQIPFGIKKKDRRYHMYIVGKTGVGKSTLLENFAIQDLQHGEGLAFIDSHGTSAEKLLSYVPEHRIKDVMYFAPFDLEHPIGFNVLEDVPIDKRHLLVAGLIATFKKTWGEEWSVHIENILSNTLLALLEYPGGTLLLVNRMHVDEVFRNEVLSHVTDKAVIQFWTKEFTAFAKRYEEEALPVIQNKFGQFIHNPLMRNIVGQPRSHFNLRKIMDERKILIANLSKGLVGEENARLLGSMITTHVSLAAMSRADQSAEDIARLPDFYFYVDEFQNFSNQTFADILSEARKYKLSLTIAHQYGEQMDEKMRAAVYGNVGTLIVFRVGPYDARTFEYIFGRVFSKEELVNLEFAQICLSLMIDGVGSTPFSAKTIPPIEPPLVHFKEKILAASKQCYGASRDVIESSLHIEPETVLYTQPRTPIPEHSAPETSSADDVSTTTPNTFEIPEKTLRALFKETP